MFEVALIFDRHGRTIAWHEPKDGTSVSIPDSRPLWDLIWENRDRIGGIAHTHPFPGEAQPSVTDTTTFRAIEQGLGRNLLWPIVTMTDCKTFVYMEYDAEHTCYGSIDTCDFQDMGFPPEHEFFLEGLKQLRDKARAEN